MPRAKRLPHVRRVEDAKERQHDLDMEKAETGDELAAGSLVPEALKRQEHAERETAVCREIQSRAEQALIAAIDEHCEGWRSDQEEVVQEIVADYETQLEKLVSIADELAIESGTLNGLVHWRAGVGGATVPGRTSGFRKRQFNPDDGRVIPADFAVMLDRLRQAARDTADVWPLSEQPEPRAQAAVTKMDAETVHKSGKPVVRKRSRPKAAAK